MLDESFNLRESSEAQIGQVYISRFSIPQFNTLLIGNQIVYKMAGKIFTGNSQGEKLANEETA
ncbi:hypothetical protein A4H97_06715 [Niastella yeongjuensis]|uniref:Uncharacterized protein n=1 Tax=Niastella yeongjuensis TaxID=354355 RepID=A0A1V9EMW8_9BACT|nr:hypothetical protein A4H97_06715 [Niastella yeongjuensis]